MESAPTMSCTPVMQYHREFKSDCSDLVYHIEVLETVRSGIRLKGDATHSNIMAGCIQLSKKPSRNLTTIRGAKLDEAAEQATTAPQQNTLTARTFASGSFCRR